MKVKLIKKQENWYNLYDGDVGIGSTHEELQGYKLSLKNCQAIERGYDLDELADFYSKSTLFVSDEVPTEKQIEDAEHISEIAFKEGFKKCLELMGDKKFSVDDVIVISEYVRVASQSTPNVRTKDLFDEYQSLQQKEWDVEIEMENAFESYRDGTIEPLDIPKSDKNGCLILKLK